VNLLVVLGRVGHEIANLGFMQEAIHLAGDNWNCAWFALGIDLGRFPFECFAIGREGTQITHWRKPQSNYMIAEE
jgi:hypothetical protein